MKHKNNLFQWNLTWFCSYLVFTIRCWLYEWFKRTEQKRFVREFCRSKLMTIWRSEQKTTKWICVACRNRRPLVREVLVLINGKMTSHFRQEHGTCVEFEIYLKRRHSLCHVTCNILICIIVGQPFIIHMRDLWSLIYFFVFCFLFYQ